VRVLRVLVGFGPPLGISMVVGEKELVTDDNNDGYSSSIYIFYSIEKNMKNVSLLSSVTRVLRLTS
jgi:hypothetical protein